MNAPTGSAIRLAKWGNASDKSDPILYVCVCMPYNPSHTYHFSIRGYRFLYGEFNYGNWNELCCVVLGLGLCGAKGFSFQFSALINLRIKGGHKISPYRA